MKSKPKSTVFVFYRNLVLGLVFSITFCFLCKWLFGFFGIYIFFVFYIFSLILVAFLSFFSLFFLIKDSCYLKLKNFKNALDLLRIRIRLMSQLKDKGVYRVLDSGFIEFPEIKFFPSKDYNFLKIEVENSISWNSVLQTIDVSPALGNFIVLESYLSKNFNFFIFEARSSEAKQKVFSNKDDYVEYLRAIPLEKILVDDSHFVSLERCSHWLVSGVTGSGKSIMILQWFILSILHLKEFSNEKSGSIYVWDIKKSDLFAGSQIVIDSMRKSGLRKRVFTASSTSEIIISLSSLMSEFEIRKKLLSYELKKGLTKSSRQLGFEDVSIFIEELGALTGSLSKKDLVIFQRALTRVFLEGRQLGFHIYASSQKLTADTLPVSWRENSSILLFGNSGRQTAIASLGTDDLPKIKLLPGQGFFKTVDNETIRSFWAPKLDFDLVTLFEELGGLNRKVFI